MINCLRAGKLFGCRFRPRYEERELSPAAIAEVRGRLMSPLPDDLEAAKTETYVRDVCERCGKTIERDSRR